MRKYGAKRLLCALYTSVASKKGVLKCQRGTCSVWLAVRWYGTRQGYVCQSAFGKYLAGQSILQVLLEKAKFYGTVCAAAVKHA
jgi:hypothetical protein